MPPTDQIAVGFIRYLQALPDFSLSYDFDSLRALLVTYVQQNYPDWRDYVESAAGMMLLEWVAFTSTQLGFRTDFLRAQGYVDSISDVGALGRLMLNVDEKLNTPSPTYVSQVNPYTLALQARMTRLADSVGDVQVICGTQLNVTTDFGPAVYEIFEVDPTSGHPKYSDVMSFSPVYFNVINRGSLVSDPSSGAAIPALPAKPWILVEGITKIETFISDGSPDQIFNLSYYPLLTDYSHNNYRATVNLIQDQTGGFVDTEWYEVDTLIHSEREDKHFELEWDGNFKAALKFGNGIFGVPPPKGMIVRIAYRVGGGTSKRLVSGRINQDITAYDTNGSTRVRVSNLVPTIGGGNGDTLLKAKSLYGSRIRRQRRLVSGEDFASYASDFPGVAKARAEVLNNDASGNLVRLRIMEYATTSEGYVRPSEGTNQTELVERLGYNLVTSSSYDSSGQKTKISLTYALPTGMGARYNPLYPNDPSFSDFCLISRNGVAKRCIVSSDGFNYSVDVLDEDCTSLFSAGVSVGLTVLNDPNYMLQLPDGAPFSFNLPGLSASKVDTLDWPGTSGDYGVAQINDEFITFAAAVDKATSSLSDTTTASCATGNQTETTTASISGNSDGSTWDMGSGHNSFADGMDMSGTNLRLLNILSRGVYGTTVSAHVPTSSRVYLSGTREDLYRAMSKVKVEPSEILLLEGRLIPLYLILTVVVQHSNSSALTENVRQALEGYFNFVDPRWGFGAPLKISQVLSTVQNIPGVKSVTYEHATQYVIPSTEVATCNSSDIFGRIVVCEDISNVPNDTCLGMLPYKESIGGLSDVISRETNKMYYLTADVSATSTSLTLSTVSGSDFSYLPLSGMVKIRDEFIAYRRKVGNILSDITRHVYGSGTQDTLKTSDLSPIYIAPNLILSIVSESI
jgi:hypothetical protein